ncbi:MAG: 4a-hydroxytetrahydrobiopterin dehydratase, partial [Nocardioides sp.]|nr:4a-hydroxytetrahydrobiopterin dehydratase [Nocardioides sp.]
DLDLRYPHLDVTLTSHDVGGLSDRDVALARRISELAAQAGVPARPEKVATLEIGLDTADKAAIAPFWRAVLGLAEGGDSEDEIVDPSGVIDTLWFQETAPHDEPRQRFHLDLHVPPEVVRGRVEETLAAGGTLVTEEFAPSFWVLADADGNKVCLCTWQGND